MLDVIHVHHGLDQELTIVGESERDYESDVLGVAHEQGVAYDEIGRLYVRGRGES